MEVSRFNLQRRDVSVQANFGGMAVTNSNFLQENDNFLTSMKETIDLEREFQTLLNENQLLK